MKVSKTLFLITDIQKNNEWFCSTFSKVEMELNIVDLIESNPITKLSSNYNNKLINRVVKSFTGYDQQLFIASFYCSLNYDQKTEFVIDLDDVWKWLGFSKKYNSLYLLEK